MWDTQNAAVPLEYRRVLGLVGHDTDPQKIRDALGYAGTVLHEILEELEEQGLVKSIDVSPDRSDLDFTGKLSLAALQAAHRQAHAELDFTGELKVSDVRAAAKKSDR